MSGKNDAYQIFSERNLAQNCRKSSSDHIISLQTDTLKEIISQFDYYLVKSSSKTYVFEDKLTKARFHVAVRTQINKFVFYFIVRRNVKCGCSEC